MSTFKNGKRRQQSTVVPYIAVLVDYYTVYTYTNIIGYIHTLISGRRALLEAFRAAVAQLAWNQACRALQVASRNGTFPVELHASQEGGDVYSTAAARSSSWRADVIYWRLLLNCSCPPSLMHVRPTSKLTVSWRNYDTCCLSLFKLLCCRL